MAKFRAYIIDKNSQGLADIDDETGEPQMTGRIKDLWFFDTPKEVERILGYLRSVHPDGGWSHREFLQIVG